MSDKHSLKVRILALLTGKTPTQIAWQLRQKNAVEKEASTPLRPVRPAGPWWHSFVPEFGRIAPMTFGLGMACVIWYALGVLGTQGDIAAFSSYTIQHFGATNGIFIHSGEWWRVLTANLVHHDLMHLAFNLYALAIAGRLVEELYGSARTMTAFVVTGVVAMTLSHVFNTYYDGNPFVTSGGASGSLCGMMGMALVGGHRLQTRQGILIRNAMAKWAGYLVIFGLIVPFVNNAAHGGGFVAGLALGAILPFRRRGQAGGTQNTVAWVMAAVLASGVFLQVSNWDEAPAGVRGFPRSFFGMTLEEPNISPDRIPGFEECMRWEPPRVPTPEKIQACTHMTRAIPHCVQGWARLQSQYRLVGDQAGMEKTKRALELPLADCLP